MGENQRVCLFAGVCVCVIPYGFGGKSGAVGSVSVWWGGVGGRYILVMLTAFYKLWLTLLPTADWILNKQRKVDESRASAPAGAALLHQQLASPRGAPALACLIFGSCSGEMQPMGPACSAWCVSGLHARKRGRWMEKGLGESEGEKGEMEQHK